MQKSHIVDCNYMKALLIHPDIEFYIREILEKNNKLIENMCDITVQKLKNQLEILLIESKNSTYRKKYSRALKVIADILFSYKRSKKRGMIFCSSRKPPLPPLERDDILHKPMKNKNDDNDWGWRHSGYGYQDAYKHLKTAIEYKNLDGTYINAKIIYKNFVGRDEFFDYVEENEIKIAIEKRS